MCISKDSLRARAKEVRAALPLEKQKEFSRTICDRVVSLLDGQDPILVYVSKPPEVETAPLISTLLLRKTSVVVPIIEREKQNAASLLSPRSLAPLCQHVLRPRAHRARTPRRPGQYTGRSCAPCRLRSTGAPARIRRRVLRPVPLHQYSHLQSGNRFLVPGSGLDSGG